MWTYLVPRNLTDFQRQALLRQMGEQARELLAEGYAVDADKLLDEMIERQRQWSVLPNGEYRAHDNQYER